MLCNFSDLSEDLGEDVTQDLPQEADESMLIVSQRKHLAD